MTGHRLESLFDPKSIAIVGISSKEAASQWAAGGMQYAVQYQRLGYEGRIYPIHRELEEIAGLKAYKSLAEVPEPLDFVIISVRNTLSFGG